MMRVPGGGWRMAALLVMAAGLLMPPPARPTTRPSPSKPADAAIKRDLESCREHANVDACYDAIRWNPNDPVLLTALGDALLTAKRPADAIRAYRRAALVAPATPGIAAKISAADAKLAPRRATPYRPAPSTGAPGAAGVQGAVGKRYSNVETETQSH